MNKRFAMLALFSLFTLAGCGGATVHEAEVAAPRGAHNGRLLADGPTRWSWRSSRREFHRSSAPWLVAMASRCC